MKRYEYRMETLKFSVGKDKAEQILDAVNRFGQAGWRLNRTFTVMLISWSGGIRMLLEREITDET